MNNQLDKVFQKVIYSGDQTHNLLLTNWAIYIYIYIWCSSGMVVQNGGKIVQKETFQSPIIIWKYNIFSLCQYNSTNWTVVSIMMVWNIPKCQYFTYFHGCKITPFLLNCTSLSYCLAEKQIPPKNINSIS